MDKRFKLLNKNKNDFRGKLTIGASSGPAEYPIPLLLGMFKHAYPNSSILLHVGDSIEIMEKVINQSIELGYIGTHRRDGNLIFEPYMEDRLVLVTAKNNLVSSKTRVSYEELCHIPLIMQQSGSGATINLQKALAKVNMKLSDLTILMEIGLQDSVKAAVLAGYGATIISEMGVKKEIESGQLSEIEIADLDLTRQIFICKNRILPLSNLANEFLKFSLQNKYQKI